MNYCLQIALFFSLLSINAGERESHSVKQIIPENKTMALPDTGKWERAVFDDEKNFSPARVNYLDSLVASHKAKTANEIVIISPDPATTVQRTTQDVFDKYANLMFVTLGVGNSYYNRGVGIFFSVKLRLIRIEVGEGLLKKLPEEETRRIIDTIIYPHFKTAKYFTGIQNGLLEICRILE